MKLIDVEDHGAGSAVIKTRKRLVHKIAASSLKHKKYAQLLFRIVDHYRPFNIVELGTSFGTTTAYMASGNSAATVYTLEGAPAIAAIAKENFNELGLDNIQLIEGNFDQTLQPLLQKIQQAGLVFIDGNHRREPTLDYLNKMLPYITADSIIIFDDIHWSEEMEEAWAEIQAHPSVTLSIDLFFIGLVFFNPDFKIKQHFKIRF